MSCRKRDGFSMLTAILVIIVMSTVSVMVLQTSMRSSRLTLDNYRDRQASLWAQSYMNYAKLAIMKNRQLMADNNQTHAIETIEASLNGTKENGGYSVTVNISYIGTKYPAHYTSSALLSTNSDNPSAIIDVYVNYSILEKGWDNLVTFHLREVVGI